MRKIWIFGDSLLRGVTYDAERKAHRLCKSHKLEKLAALGFEIENHSHMGATVRQGYDAFLYEKEKILPGDCILFEYGGNDCDFDWSAVAADPTGRHEPHLGMAEYLALYGRMIDEAKETGAEVRMATLLPIDAARYFAWISRDKDGDSILGWLGDVGQLYRWQESYARAAEALCLEKGCVRIDLRGAFLARRDFPALIAADGIHPTNEGHRLVEEVLCRAFAER